MGKQHHISRRKTTKKFRRAIQSFMDKRKSFDIGHISAEKLPAVSNVLVELGLWDGSEYEVIRRQFEEEKALRHLYSVECRMFFSWNSKKRTYNYRGCDFSDRHGDINALYYEPELDKVFASVPREHHHLFEGGNHILTKEEADLVATMRHLPDNIWYKDNVEWLLFAAVNNYRVRYGEWILIKRSHSKFLKSKQKR